MRVALLLLLCAIVSIVWSADNWRLAWVSIGSVAYGSNWSVSKHIALSANALGMVVVGPALPSLYLLSNNHVL